MKLSNIVHTTYMYYVLRREGVLIATRRGHAESQLDTPRMQRTTVIALLVRVSIALLTKTFFQPDEYFQSLEVAHYIVFGYGHLTWEWLAPRPIRSILYPALNVPVYWLLKVAHLDHTILLVGTWFRLYSSF